MRIQSTPKGSSVVACCVCWGTIVCCDWPINVILNGDTPILVAGKDCTPYTRYKRTFYKREKKQCTKYHAFTKTSNNLNIGIDVRCRTPFSEQWADRRLVSCARGSRQVMRTPHHPNIRSRYQSSVQFVISTNPQLPDQIVYRIYISTCRMKETTNSHATIH